MHALFLSNTRMYELTWRDGAGPDLPVEAWWGREALSAGFELCIDLLATDAHLELKRFLGRAVRLATRLSDGGQAHRSGFVRADFHRRLGSVRHGQYEIRPARRLDHRYAGRGER